MDTAINGTITVSTRHLLPKNHTLQLWGVHHTRLFSLASESLLPGETRPSMFNPRDPETFWRTGNELEDLRAMVDAAYTDIEIKDVSDSPYNKRWKAAWLKRARELGATPEP